MNAVILARVPTKDQEDFGHSLPAQTQKLPEYAEKKGFEVIKEFSFSESAGTKIRKKFEEILTFLKSQKEMPVLLCQNVDRVTRNFRDAVDLDDMRINRGLEIHFVQDGFVLSSKELFDNCQRIRLDNGRTKAVKETKHPFIFRGLITCAVTGRKVTSDLKKGKYVYLISHDPKNPKKKIFTPETKITEQIETVFQSIKIPDDVLSEIINHLKQTHELEKEFHHTSIKRLHRESEDLFKKLDKLTDLLLDESITKDIYHKKHQDMTQRQFEINKELEQHHEGNDKFKIALSMLVTLASKAWDIFKSSNVDEKRQLMGYVFSNLELEGGKLRYALNTPFNLFANMLDYQEWRPVRESNPCYRRERAVS